MSARAAAWTVRGPSSRRPSRERVERHVDRHDSARNDTCERFLSPWRGVHQDTRLGTTTRRVLGRQHTNNARASYTQKHRRCLAGTPLTAADALPPAFPTPRPAPHTRGHSCCLLTRSKLTPCAHSRCTSELRRKAAAGDSTPRRGSLFCATRTLAWRPPAPCARSACGGCRPPPPGTARVSTSPAYPLLQQHRGAVHGDDGRRDVANLRAANARDDLEVGRLLGRPRRGRVALAVEGHGERRRLQLCLACALAAEEAKGEPLAILPVPRAPPSRRTSVRVSRPRPGRPGASPNRRRVRA